MSGDPRSLLSSNRLVADLIPLLREKVVVRYSVRRSESFIEVGAQSDMYPSLVAHATFAAVRKQRLVKFGIELTLTDAGYEIGETEVTFKTDIPGSLTRLLREWEEEGFADWRLPDQFVGTVQFSPDVQPVRFPVTHGYFKALHGFAAAAVTSKMHELYKKDRTTVFEPDIFSGGIEDRFRVFLGEAVYERWSEDFFPILYPQAAD